MKIFVVVVNDDWGCIFEGFVCQVLHAHRKRYMPRVAARIRCKRLRRLGLPRQETNEVRR
jgi:hypothetical protein